MKKCLYLSVFFIAFFSSCSDNELEEMSNSVPLCCGDNYVGKILIKPVL